MTPNFALSLSFEGIALLRRMGDTWARIQEVALDNPDLETAVIGLRNKAESLDPDGAKVALLIPNEQIRYLSFPDPGGDDVTRDVAARAALEGATPYAVSDLSFDISLHHGSMMIAAVANETLEEAVGFAKAHGFTPVCNIAQSDSGAFVGPVYFGKAKGWRRAVSRITKDIVIVAADEEALLPVPALRPEPEPAPEPVPEPEPTPAPEPDPAPEPTPSPVAAPEAEVAKEDEPAAPVTLDAQEEVAPVEEAKAESPQLSLALDAEDTEAPAAEPAAEDEPEDLTPHERRLLRRQRKAEAEARKATQAEEQKADEVPEEKATEALTEPQEDAQNDPEPAPEAQDAETPEAPEPEAPEAEKPKTPEAPAPRPATRVEPSFEAPKPSPTPAVAADSRKVPPPLNTPEASAIAASSAFASMRVRAERSPGDLPAPPKTEVDASALSARVSPRFTPVDPARLKAETAAKTLRAEAPEQALAAAAPADTAAKSSGKGGLLSGLRKRMNGASKPAAAQDSGSKARAALSKAVAEVKEQRHAPKPKQIAPEAPPIQALPDAQTPEAPTKTGLGKLGIGAARKAKPEKKPRKAKEKTDTRTDAQKARDAEAERLTVFGQRSNQRRVGGKPRFLGLILTSILLLFLIVVAAWATVFVEDGIAGLFGRSDKPVAVAQEDLPPTEEPAGNNTPAEPQEDTEAGEEVLLAALENEPVAPAPLAQPVEPRALTREEAAATYAATGIWQRAPNPPLPIRPEAIEDPYIASIDPTVQQHDAVALPNVSRVIRDPRPEDPGLPPRADQTFDFDDRGLVRATPEGAITPDGLRVFTGRPPIVPPLRGVIETPAPESSAEAPPPQATENALALFRPESRPSDLIEQRERASHGGISLSELAQLRPSMRPKTVQETAAEETPDAPATAQAVQNSLAPVTRPRNIAAIVKRAEKQRAEAEPAPVRTAAVAPRTVQPSGSIAGAVARNATVKNAINLSKVSLIGVYGTPSNRRALVRLPSGKYQKVKAGDRLDGGRVQRIDEGALRYSKGGRNITLKMPRG
ncbi:MAG: hypothetical protein N4A70_19975 [Pelagimonas sp.]|jgi:hypothetical protein|nr:hypothetical protein [Pelagimonas sp.]